MTNTRRPWIDLGVQPTVAGTHALPGSKSISNRVLLLAALADGDTLIDDLLDSDDTRVMRGALEALGVTLAPEGAALKVSGCGGRFPTLRAELFVGNSGLSIRTLVPAIAAVLAGSDDADARVALSGIARMHERPIGDLVDGLAQLGARVEWLGTPGYPPLALRPAPLTADRVSVRGNVSSQFLTGLLQAAPLVAREKPLVIEVEGELISKPYVHITLSLMQRFGVGVERNADWTRFVVAAGQGYRAPGRIAVEGDASTASYFLAAGALGGGPIRVTGAGRNSIQGDVRFADALGAMGAQISWGYDWIEAAAPPDGLRGVDLDCNHIPDAAMTLAVCALSAAGPTTLRNIGSWRVKETDRIAAVAAECRKLGAAVEEGADWIRIVPPAQLRSADIATYDDHRMAMAFSLATLGARGVPLRILDPDCVAKTFPGYFDVFARLGATRP